MPWPRRGRAASGPRQAGPARAAGRSGPRILVGLAVAVATTYGWFAARAPDDTPAYVDHAGQVTQVSDGDTLRFATATGELRIRLDSIDAPERDAGPRRPGQPFADASTAHLTRWLAHRTLVARCYEQDQYERSVCDLVDDQGQSAARAQVLAGYAWAYTAAGGRYLRDASLVDAQTAARAAGRGLWQNRQVIPPWVWRYDCWRKDKCSR